MVLITKVIPDILPWKHTYSKSPCTVQHSRVRPRTVGVILHHSKLPSRREWNHPQPGCVQLGSLPGSSSRKTSDTLLAVTRELAKSDPPPRITCSQVGRVRCHHTPDSHCSQLGFLIDIRTRYSYLISILTNNSAKTITTSILCNNRASPSWTRQRIHPTSAPKHPCD